MFFMNAEVGQLKLPMPPETRRGYEVGFGKPPAHSRFKKGQSGNPRGRPPGAKNLKTLLYEALNERVIVAENGRRRKISKLLAIIKQVINQSAKPDWRYTKILLDIIRDIERQGEPAFPATSAEAGSHRYVVILPDNGRDPEETEQLRKQQDEYLAENSGDSCRNVYDRTNDMGV